MTESPKQAAAVATREDALLTVVSQIAEGQKRDLAVKEKELTVRSEEIASNERIALASISAQERSHKEGGISYTRHIDHRNIFVIVIVAMVMIFAGCLVGFGAKEILMEIIKIVGSCAVGIFGGYQYGKNKRDSNDDS